jgi:hypothetical protein
MHAGQIPQKRVQTCLAQGLSGWLDNAVRELLLHKYELVCAGRSLLRNFGDCTARRGMGRIIMLKVELKSVGRDRGPLLGQWNSDVRVSTGHCQGVNQVYRPLDHTIV